MITLCTSTCYFGVDFYSENAQIFVISDCHIANTTVDISTELPQIVGRLRNVKNPFRSQIFFIYNSWNGKKDIQKQLKSLEEKHRVSQVEVDYFNQAPEDVKPNLMRYIKREKDTSNDSTSYTYYDEKEGKFALNYMSILSDEYQLRVQYDTYHSNLAVYRSLEERNELNVSESVQLLTVTEHVQNTILKTTFAEQMERYCEYRDQEGLSYDLLMMDFEKKNPKFRTYFDAIGSKRIRALGFKEKSLQNELKMTKQSYQIHQRMREAFPVGTQLSAEQFKKRMNEIYTEVGVKRNGKVSDLQKEYGMKVQMHNINVSTGVRKRFYEIIGN